MAARGWYVLPLSAASKRPLGNCPACRDRNGRPPHRIEDCPCIPAGAWCHGVRAATLDPERIATWWQHEPDAIPGIAAGPSGLVLLDIDTHADTPPADPATGLLPGIDLTAEPISNAVWTDASAFRDGRDTLRLLARLRGGERPWPTDPGHRPVTVTTPSGGRHLWYRAPAANLRQALSPHSIAWQVDIKAGWSYGIAPGATATAGRYQITGGDPAHPGLLPGWLTREVLRIAAARDHRPAPPLPRPRPARTGARGPAAYLTTVINRGAAELAALTDGRQRALAALAYQTGGLLEWSGLAHDQTTEQLITAGTAAGLPYNLAARIVHRSLTRGLDDPLPEPGSSHR
ncbi:bifunctional DNA primase/polymerase [Actinoallomurus acanthiterrae]